MEAKQGRIRSAPMFMVQGKALWYVEKVIQLYFEKGLNSTEISNRTGSSVADVVHVVMKFNEYRQHYHV